MNKICNECKTVVHCTKHGCISKQPSQQEPFGYFKAEPFGWTDCAETDEGAIALYTSPQPAQPSKPLTDDQIAKFYGGDSPIVFQIIRDTEAAHGIKENT